MVTTSQHVQPHAPPGALTQLAALKREAQARREEGMAAAKARKERMLALEEEARLKVGRASALSHC